MIKTNLKAIDFFCGGGGMSYGLSKASIRVLAGIDCDASCRDTYTSNNPNSKFLLTDITELTPENLLHSIDIQRNDPNLVFVGCSPCQYWTLLATNKSKSKATKNLLHDFLRFVRFFKPGFVVIENVPGLLKNKKENLLPYFINSLKQCGYSTKYDVLNANDFGVPQNRYRLLLIASRQIKEFELPKPMKGRKRVVKDVLGVKNGFSKIPPGNLDTSKFLHTTADLSYLNRRRLKKTKKNGGTRLDWKDDPELQINAYKGRDHCFRDVYGRMYWERPAPTITTKFMHISNGRFAHPEEDRGISLREGATLQSFPKTYKFKCIGQASAARLIGNAVPPKLAKVIGKTLINISNGENSE